MRRKYSYWIIGLVYILYCKGMILASPEPYQQFLENSNQYEKEYGVNVESIYKFNEKHSKYRLKELHHIKKETDYQVFTDNSDQILQPDFVEENNIKKEIQSNENNTKIRKNVRTKKEGRFESALQQLENESVSFESVQKQYILNNIGVLGVGIDVDQKDFDYYQYGFLGKVYGEEYSNPVDIKFDSSPKMSVQSKFLMKNKSSTFSMVSLQVDQMQSSLKDTERRKVDDTNVVINAEQFMSKDAISEPKLIIYDGGIEL